MVYFPRLLQLRVFNGLCLDFGTLRGLVFLIEFRSILWSIMACYVECFCGHLYATIGLKDEVVIACV